MALKQFSTSTESTMLSRSSNIAARTASPVASAPPGMPTQSCRGASDRPRPSSATRAQRPDRRYHTSPMAMGRTPPVGLARPMRRESSSTPQRGSLPLRRRLTTPWAPSRASGDAFTAARSCSNVHPVGPPAAPRLRSARASAVSNWSSVTCIAGSSSASGSGSGRRGCLSCKLRRTSGSPASAKGAPRSARAPRETLPRPRWPSMRAASR